MSKIAIIGATGRAGSQLLEEALRRGHQVTAIARHASAKIGQRAGVVAKDVDVNDAQALQAAVAGHDVVLSAAHFSTLTPQAIIEPVKKAGVNRLLVVGGAGSLLLPDGTRVIDWPAAGAGCNPLCAIMAAMRRRGSSVPAPSISASASAARASPSAAVSSGRVFFLAMAASC